jgi:probable phosphoglycerate mutase
MKNITLYFLRHGESTYNRANIVQGQLDSPLTREGKKQTEEIAKKFENLGIKMIAHSKLTRAKETAEIVNGLLKVPVKQCEGIEEMNFGDFQHELKQEHWRKFEHDFYTNGEAPPGGENKNDLFKRAEHAVKNICNGFPEDPILIVSHKMLIRILIGRWFTKWSEKELKQIKLPNLSIYRVDLDYDFDKLIPRSFKKAD